MKKRILQAYKREDNKFKGSSRKITSFYSSLIAGLFVATSFMFVNYFIPYGSDGWFTNWIKLSLPMVLYLLIYYYFGLLLIRGLHEKEVKSFNYNFLAALIGAIYISMIVLLKPGPLFLSVLTIVLALVFLVIGHFIANKKYRRKKRPKNQDGKKVPHILNGFV